MDRMGGECRVQDDVGELLVDLRLGLGRVAEVVVAGDRPGSGQYRRPEDRSGVAVEEALRAGSL